MHKILLTDLKEIIKKYHNFISFNLKSYSHNIKSDVKERNRFLILSLSFLFLVDYLLFCYISERNPLNIFPSLPLLENTKTINIYLPDIDGKTILKETREISIPDGNEGYVKLIISKLISGSTIDNTSATVPVDIFIRKIWFHNDTCIIDLIPTLLEDKRKLIPGTEKIFKESLEKTITENIPYLKNVIFLERGIPGRNLWQQNL